MADGLSPVETGSASTSSTFTLLGGQYGVAVVLGAGDVQLQVQGPDNETWLNCLASALSGSGTAVVDLPPGSYRFSMTNSPSGVYVSCLRVPTRTT
jgi:hypothetical protein